MPGKVKVKIISGRNLPVMDRSSDTTDAYVEIKLGTTTFKTDVCRKSLHPQWNSEWYRFEMDDAELQDEPLQIRLMDHDTYSANDAIGKVYLDLNPLLLPVTSLLGKWNDGGNSCHEGNSSVMSGWIPVYDTMHGIRGEVNVVVKVELFTDFNKFRQSSCGVQFFCSPAIPHGFYAQVIHGFVEELVVNDDPEYQWIDKIRTPRASNEARQTLFCKLSGELQRRIGLKALEMGGNAVIGYNQCFDLEGESGIVARGIGTAVTLVRILDLPPPSPNPEQNNTTTTTTEERAASYLKFLGSAKGFYLNNNSNLISNKFITSDLYSIPSPTASFRSLKIASSKRILKPEKMPPFLTRHLSDREFNYPLPVGPESMMQHSVSLQTLLKQEDQRGRPGYGISQRFRNLKYTSQNMITRKMTALKAKLGSEDEDGKGILMKYRRTQSDNGGMAEILVRSVFHATTSLDCIAESPQIRPDDENRMFLSLPIPVAGSSPVSSCNSIDSISSVDDDEDDDEDEDEEEATGDTIGELDTVSHIVETVRKLSMIQSPIVVEPDSTLQYDQNKFLFVIGDVEDQSVAGFDVDDIEDDGNLLYYQDEVDNDVEKSESFLPQFAHAFEIMRNKATMSKSASGADLQFDAERTLNKKFTSLHNIHASESRWNKYSAHGGKETVLGELFRRIDSAHPLSEVSEDGLDDSLSVSDYQISVDTGQFRSDEKALSGTLSGTAGIAKEEVHVGLKRTKPLKLFVDSQEMVAPEIIDKTEDTMSESMAQHDNLTDSGLEKTKHDSKGFLTKKVLKVLKKLDSKLHHHKNLPKKPKDGVQGVDSSQGQQVAHKSVESPSMSMSHLSADSLDVSKRSEHSSGSDEHKHGLLHILKEGTDKLIHAPVDLYHKIDSKIHEFGHHSHLEEKEIGNEDNKLVEASQGVVTGEESSFLGSGEDSSKVLSSGTTELHLPGHSQDSEDQKQEETHLEHSSGSEERKHGIRPILTHQDHLKHEETLSVYSTGSEDRKHGILDKLLHGPKELIHKIDHKIHDIGHHHHDHHHSGIKNEHGLLNLALGNVLMDTVQDVLATSHTASPNDKPPEFPVTFPEKPQDLVSAKTNETGAVSSSQPNIPVVVKKQPEPYLPGHSHVLDLEIPSESLKQPILSRQGRSISLPHLNEDLPDIPGRLKVNLDPGKQQTPKSAIGGTCQVNSRKEETDSQHSSTGSEDRKHSILDRLKEGKDRLLHGPMELIHKIDHKIHDIGHHHHDHHHSGIKNEHGLLNLALGNVLMDTVQDVLATSHTASPNDKPPEFPVLFQPGDDPGEGKLETGQDELKSDLPDPVLEINEPNLKKDLKYEETQSEHTNHGLLDKLKDGKDRLVHKIHDMGHHHNSGIKNDHGLLNIALGNVLMDSVQEVLATSSASPSSQSQTPEFPIIKDQEASELEETPEPNNSTLKKPLLSSLGSSCQTPSSNIKETLTFNSNILLTGSDQSNLTIPAVTTQTDAGDRDCINTTHACLTTPRNVELVLPSNATHAVQGAAPTATTAPGPGPVVPTASVERAENGHHRTESLGVRISHSPAKLNAIPCIHRRSSDSDLSITPKGNSLTGSDRSGGYSSGQYMRAAMLRTTRPQENFDIMEYPFLTLSKYPPGFIAHIGGSVSARSVKLLERISNIEEPESRDTWWSEIRMEIRSHARALNCNAVLGYTESTSICDDVCVLSASGTAAVLGFPHISTEAADNLGGLPVLPKNNNAPSTMTTSLDRNDFERDKDKDKDKENKEKDKLKDLRGDEKFVDKPISTVCNNNSIKTKVISANGTADVTKTSPERESGPAVKSGCSLSHLPYVSNSKPLRASSIKCCTCGAYKVPDMLIATIEIPDGMPNFGRGCFIQSYVCRPLKDLKGESNAKEISDGLPFLEYELHRFLINKLKVKGMNAIFGLKVRISIGERMLIGIATGTAVFLSSLPPPLLPKLVSDRTTDEKKLTQLQKDLHDTIRRNREIYQLRSIEEVNGESGKLLSESDGSEDEAPVLDLAMGNKDCCILEVDDPDDADVLKSLMEARPPDGFHVVNTEHVPGLEDLEIVKNLQMFTQIWRAKIPPPFDLDKHFHRLLQSVYFKLRRMIPCALCDLQFRVDSPEPDEIQLCVLGMALGLGDPVRNPKKRKIVITKRNDDDLIFNLEEDQIPEHSVVQTPPTTHLLHAQSLKHRQKSPIRNKLLTKQRHVPYRERHGVDITPLSYVPGGKIEKYLGNLNFFFIRETTSLREEGGLSGFVHSFVTEILAIVRAHVTALGGNAMVAYFITECVLNHNLHKNQGQCLINVGGDVVYVSYFTEDH